MRPADTTLALPSDARGPAGWRIAMVFCHVLMGLTLVVAGFYLLVKMKVFDLL